MHPSRRQPSANLYPLLIIMGVLLLILGGAYACFGPLYAATAFSILADPQSVEGLKELLIKDGITDTTFLDAYVHLAKRSLTAFLLGPVLLGAALAWLGYGNIMARRWCQKILLAFGWVWLVGTIGTIIFAACSWAIMTSLDGPISSWLSALSPPASTAAGGPPPGAGFGSVFGIFTGSFFIAQIVLGVLQLIPGALLIVIYSLRNIRLTIELHDPKPRWTDPLPIPVVALWVALVLWGILTALLIPSAGGWLAIFHPGISEIAGTLLQIIILVWIIATASFVARFKVLGWWSATIGVTALTILAVYGAANFDFWQMLTHLNLPEKWMKPFHETMPNEVHAQVTQISNKIWFPPAVLGGLALAYLGWLKTQWPQGSAEQATKQP